MFQFNSGTDRIVRPFVVQLFGRIGFNAVNDTTNYETVKELWKGFDSYLLFSSFSQFLNNDQFSIKPFMKHMINARFH